MFEGFFTEMPLQCQTDVSHVSLYIFFLATFIYLGYGIMLAYFLSAFENFFNFWPKQNFQGKYFFMPLVCHRVSDNL